MMLKEKIEQTYIKHSNIFIFCVFALFILISIIFRIPFYKSYFIPGFSRDIFTYFQPVSSMLSGYLPHFTFYTPGYPLFLYFINLINISTIKGLLLFQNAACFSIIIMSLIVLMKDLRFRYFLIIFSGILIFYNSPGFINEETKISPVALYTCLLILFSIIIFKIVLKTKLSLSLLIFSSFIIGLLIFIRPQGTLSLILFFPFFLHYLYYNRRLKILWALLPFSMIILVMMFYNWGTTGNFTSTNQSFYQNVRSSMFVMKKDNSYPAYINSAIDSINSQILRDKNAIIKNPDFKISNIDELGDKFLSIIYQQTGGASKVVNDEIDEICKKRKFTKEFAVYAFSNFLKSVKCFSLQSEFYTNELKNRKFYIEESEEYLCPTSAAIRALATKDFYESIYSTKKVNTNSSINDQSKFLNKFVCFVNHKYFQIFNPTLFVALYFLCLIMSFIVGLVNILKRKYFNILNLYFLLLLSIPLANYLVVSIYVYPSKGYFITTDWIILFTPVLVVYFFGVILKFFRTV